MLEGILHQLGRPKLDDLSKLKRSLRKLLDYDFGVPQRGDATHRLKSKHMDALIDPIDSTPLPTPEEDQENKSAKAVKVFSYACKIAYPEEAAHVEHQLTLTHRHRNLLTETLLKGREKYREIIKEHLGLDIKALEEQAKEVHRNQSGPPRDLRLEKTKQDN